MNVNAVKTHIADDILIETIFAQAAKLTAFLKEKGFAVRPTGAHVGSAIFEAAPHKIQKINQDFSFLESIVKAPSSFRKTDVEMTQDVLQALNMYVPDGFWKTVHPDDVIELYRDDGVQIFRSFNMFKTTGYSLLDLNLYSWEELWERSSYSTAQLTEACQQILLGQKEIISFNLREDIIKEILNSTLTQPFEPRTLSVKLGQITAIRDLDTGTVQGFAITTRSKVLSVGKSTEKLSFI